MNAVDVAIIGLGPTGLTLAHFLGKRGLSVKVFERDKEFYGRARAVYTDDECMRAWQWAGIADELAPDMIQDQVAQWVRPDGRVLSQMVLTDRPHGWPVMNFLYQPWLETKMESLIRERYPNVSLHRGVEVLGFEQDADGVTLRHRPVDGADEQTTRATYLVACDGGRSKTREEGLGIKMTGGSFPERWLVIDLEVEDADTTLRHLPYFSFVCDPERPIVNCPQPGAHHRFEFMLNEDDDKEEWESDEKVRSLLSRFIDPNKAKVLRKLVYTFNALNAEQWRKGRVILAGDAAHMTPQFMGQGMSSGIRDAANIAWKLDMILRGQAGDALLDSYMSERRPHAQSMIDVSIMMMKVVSVRSRLLAALRNSAMVAAGKLPWVKGELRRGAFKPGPDFRKGRFWGLPRDRRNGAEGRLIPQPQVRSFLGKITRADDVLGEGFSLIGIGTDPWAELSDAAKLRWQGIGVQSAALWTYTKRPQGVRTFGALSPETIEIEDTTNELSVFCRKHGVGQGDVLIVRPDRVVAAVARPQTMEAVSQQLFNKLGSPEHTVERKAA
ncbi:bifunctional 3-(3-hydroxy-phenyl)propionate/3-hydroxycinnamic acid hydroxylase [Lutimaribacter marinistellae]|uniref:Bifunctional 3-(3-hydroxy-phenyl)propionate/3-hydroxycinnamic acid hydroxylase n=1 Tax=Lutimaribacter marinistellae TaxID=1820329 RepID=A0ABV7TDP1_9RHOB